MAHMELTWMDLPVVDATSDSVGLQDVLQDEMADVAELLREFASTDCPPPEELISRIALSSMGPRHLWEDLGMASRDELNALMLHHFPRLKALNSGNMRWKKFLYRMLCERAEVLICKAPHCSQCEEQRVCFDPG
jgi:nitrogen fixation protein NifQ